MEGLRRAEDVMDEWPRYCHNPRVHRTCQSLLLECVSSSWRNGQIWVLTGDQVIFYADNVDAVEAFLYGMGLAYSVIPSQMAIDVGRSIGLGEEDLKEMGVTKRVE